jgi:hypothetical protein
MPGSPLAWRKGMARRLIDILVKKDFAVVAGGPGAIHRTLVVRNEATGEIEERPVEMTEPDEHGMQFNVD